MNSDTAILLGLFLLILAIPAIISAMSERRAPRVAALVLIGGGALVVYAFRSKEGGYTAEELPMVLYTMIGKLMQTAF
ncbi:hypothetical protein [Pseudoprimorskyibacter insulae]|uniref:50S ribosomal protein L35 n=1 Tax=Pseudoprimorskyibacter insulae TaxID=1695997 RepID=A0A2R8ANQ9_9RHOB|nr:hypothetical protein [Pseudoprimorskyibacter insulae]SPF77681.1 hypothetical protein PRI8871_00265 [Pseudoprimorskyibacter insulae]